VHCNIITAGLKAIFIARMNKKRGEHNSRGRQQRLKLFAVTRIMVSIAMAASVIFNVHNALPVYSGAGIMTIKWQLPPIDKSNKKQNRYF
jgi:hypothetical protein